MRQFDTTQQADVLVEGNRATIPQFRNFGGLLANQHRRLPQSRSAPVLDDAVMANFTALESLESCERLRARLKTLRAATEQELGEKADLLASRAGQGYIRECHGDLHWSNMVAVDGLLSARST